VHGFIRGLTIFRFAPDRPGSIDAERGEDARLQVRPLVLARALGNRQGHLRLCRLLWTPIIAVDRHGSRITVYIALVEAKDLVGSDSTGRQYFHRAGVIKPISNPPYGVLIKGFRRDSLAQQQRRIWMGKELFHTLQRTATTQGSEDHPEDNGPWIDGHLGRYHLLDHLNQANLVGIGLHKGQMLDWVRFDCRWHGIHTALQEGPWFISSHMTQT
jgi:hypothetical protein